MYTLLYLKWIASKDPLYSTGRSAACDVAACMGWGWAWTSLVAQMVKNLPAMGQTQVQSLGWEDPLEEGMATHSRILAWRIPMDRGAWSAAVHGVGKK